MNVIEVEDLCFAYNSIPVLKNVSLTVSSKEFIGIFGPNGGGKTTFLNLLMGFLKPSKGRISIYGDSPKNKQKLIAWVPQSFSFDPSFPISVKEVVLMGRLRFARWYGRFHEQDLQKVKTALGQVGMESSINAPFSALSGGQMQRVLIARALASNPSLLLLDEPTSGIDYETQNEIYKLLGKLKQEITILMVTHDLSGLINQVDRFFCIQETLTPMSREKLCEHFALGLYHPPLKPEAFS
ncbi:MAG: metal ABC transporter ATP-binding protein [Chlamydiales bacterium]